MDIVNVKISEIRPYSKNAKKHDKKQIKNVAESIRQYGFVQPVVLDKNNEIVIGHCRWEAAKLLKKETGGGNSLCLCRRPVGCGGESFAPGR